MALSSTHTHPHARKHTRILGKTHSTGASCPWHMNYSLSIPMMMLTSVFLCVNPSKLVIFTLSLSLSFFRIVPNCLKKSCVRINVCPTLRQASLYVVKEINAVISNNYSSTNDAAKLYYLLSQAGVGGLGRKRYSPSYRSSAYVFVHV